MSDNLPSAGFAGRLRPVSKRVQSMPRSAIREIMALAGGRSDVLHLEVGEPEFSTPEWITAGAFAGVRDGATRYTPNAGTLALRRAIAAKVSAAQKVDLTADNIVVTTGAIGALFSAIYAVCDPGDEILVPDPGWPNYRSIAHLAGLTAVGYRQPAEAGFLPSVAEIEALITPRTKAIVINTPGNPTGAVFPEKLTRDIGRLVERHGIYLISDEVYEDFVFEGRHVGGLEVTAPENTLIVSGVSKSYAMTGWRIGYLVCPPEIARLASAIQEPITSCPPAPSQVAALAALTGPQDDMATFREVYRRRRDILVEVFGKGSAVLPVTPEGAFYGFIDISASGQDSLSFARRLLTEHGVAAVPGITFGPDSGKFLRVAFTIGDDGLREAFHRIRKAIGP